MQNIEKLITEQLRNPNELDISLRMEFGPFETVHKWKRMSECYEFVGARRSKHTAIAYKDAIYVFGGDNGKSMLNDLIRFDIKEKSWTKTLCMGIAPAPRYHHSAVVHRSSMFVFGGYTGDILANSNLTNKNDLFEYKFPTAQWIQWKFTGQEPVPRSAHGAAVYDDKLWIFAGYDGNARLNDMWTINLVGENHQWEHVEQKGECPPTCCNFPVAVARGRMFVFSGQSGANITNALFQFDFESHTWSRVCTEHLLRSAGPAPARRYGHVMLHHARHLYVFGGAADSTLPSDLHCYDLDTQMWSVVHPAAESQIPSGRLFHAGAVVGDAMYIFGGTVDNNVRSGDLYRFQLSNYPRCTLHDDFGRILKSQQFCDVTLLVGADQTAVFAHQAMLAARSQYLRAKIKEANEELAKRIAAGEEEPTAECSYKARPKLTVKLPEATPEAFRMVLNYIYTDRIDPTEKDEDPASPATILLVMEVLRLALRLNIPRLRGLCARYLRANLCYSNVLQALHAAHHANLTCIKEYCLRFVVKDYNFTAIVMSPAFEEMEQKLMVEVIRRRHQPHHKLAPNHDQEEEVQGTTLEQDMSVFVGGAELADVTLRVAGATRPAHRSILAARAAYFEAMFRSFSPRDNVVNVHICNTVPSEEAFDSLLRYLYYGDTNMPTEDSLYLFQAPIYYGFTNNRLQVFCKHNLQSNVSPDNVLAILQAADRMSAADIKDYALKMIVHHFELVSVCDMRAARNTDKQTNKHNLQSNVSPDKVLAILQAADRMSAADIKDYALKMIVHHFELVARQEAIKNLAQPLLVDLICALADDPRFDSLPQPRSLPSSSSADTITDDPEYIRHRCAK
ncbi:leucine-zipper-like transcriptional regulator 1 homolog isoform X2 [Bicyclus anynana]|uniref:Leucine-zipper-like transcriptional regulator 1 homolog isoform X2 n=1 Tax=Bicyclus anynana TaxID=110368 RepID=A0ABM3LI36_BICAN|nr:leucine-zipper-like transcriptional regulator 1 homolog isoform X2 [Bicyclus anynana]